MTIWHDAGPAFLDVEGVLWDWAPHLPRPRKLGPVEGAVVPAGLAEAHAECLDVWRDAFSARDEQLAAWEAMR